MFSPGRVDGTFRFLAGQHVQCLLSHDDMPGRRGEDRHQADGPFVPARFVPGEPDAVRGAESRLAEMGGELFGGKRVLACRNLGRLRFIGIVVGVDDQLTFDRNGFVGRIIEKEAAAKASCRLAVGMGHDVRRPDGGHPRGRLKFAFNKFRFFGSPRESGAPDRHGTATRQAQRHQAKGDQSRTCHGEVPHRISGDRTKIVFVRVCHPKPTERAGGVPGPACRRPSWQAGVTSHWCAKAAARWARLGIRRAAPSEMVGR